MSRLSRVQPGETREFTRMEGKALINIFQQWLFVITQIVKSAKQKALRQDVPAPGFVGSRINSAETQLEEWLMAWWAMGKRLASNWSTTIIIRSLMSSNM